MSREHVVVVIGEENLPPFVCAGKDVVQRLVAFYVQGARHESRLSVKGPLVDQNQ
jgi:hypothetical protein